MTKEVIIKSNKYGMELILDDKLPFPELLDIIRDRFQESGNFFKNAKMAVSFKGRSLTGEEELSIVDAIMENSPIQIVSIMDLAGVQEERMKERLDAFQESQGGSVAQKSSARGTGSASRQSGAGQKTQGQSGSGRKAEAVPGQQANFQNGFYKGNLRSGQVLECPESVTLIGDVNPGARIESAGNVVILGALKGTACAGSGGDNSCFIFALDMQPIQLQIGEYIAKSPDREKESRHLFKREKAAPAAYNPQIAVARRGTIYIEPMTKGCLDNL